MVINLKKNSGQIELKTKNHKTLALVSVIMNSHSLSYKIAKSFTTSTKKIYFEKTKIFA